MFIKNTPGKSTLSEKYFKYKWPDLTAKRDSNWDLPSSIVSSLQYIKIMRCLISANASFRFLELADFFLHWLWSLASLNGAPWAAMSHCAGTKCQSWTQVYCHSWCEQCDWCVIPIARMSGSAGCPLSEDSLIRQRCHRKHGSLCLGDL